MTPDDAGGGNPHQAGQILVRLFIAVMNRPSTPCHHFTRVFGQMGAKLGDLNATRIAVEQQFAYRLFQFLDGTGDGLRRCAQAGGRFLEAV